jgi:hypothetical protein
MSKLNLITQRIVYFRMLRPVLDLAILLAALAVLICLRNLEAEQQLNKKPNLRIQQQVPASKALFIEEQFNTENDLWQAWGSWIDSNQPSSGQCLVETKPAPIEMQFYLLCFGKEGVGKRQAEPIPNTLNDKNIFVQPKAPRAIPAEKITAKVDKPTYKVQGWINTTQGTKTFDPDQKKWLP